MSKINSHPILDVPKREIGTLKALGYARHSIAGKYLGCIVLTGEGDKSFVAGADIGSMSTMTNG